MDDFKFHFDELRNRFLKSVVVFLISFFICYYFSNYLFKFIAAPLIKIWKSHHKFIYTGVTEAFTVHLKLASFGGLLISIPYTLTQLWRFIAPGLYNNERKIFVTVLSITPLLFIVGAAFAYYFVMPLAYKFFLSFELNNSPIPVHAELRLEEYLSFVIHLILIFGICFQMPVFLLVLTKSGLVTISSLKENWRIVVFIISIISAIFAPPDIFSMIFLIIPLVTLYALSIKLCSFFSKKED